MLGVGGVDSAGERLGDSFEHFAAQAARHERCQAFVAMAAAARNQWFDHHAELAERRKQRTAQHWEHPRGSEQREAFGDFGQRSVAHHIGPAELGARGD